MKSRLVKVGNSRGIRLLKALIDEAGLSGEVDIHAEPRLITVRPLEPPRKGWAEAVEETSSEGLLDDPTPTEFESTAW